MLAMGIYAAFSWQVPYGVSPADAPMAQLVGFGILSGALWMLLIPLLRRVSETQKLLIFIAVAGCIMRAALFFSTPIIEDDSYRYLWDGAAVANGINPFAYAPIEAAELDLFGVPIFPSTDPELAFLQSLAAENRVIHERINIPYVTTIYPPIAQAAFASAYFIEPFSLTSWRAVLFVVELISFVLLAQTLRAYGRGPHWAAMYWWNPLVITQVFGAGHMDVLLVPFLLGVLLFLKRSRYSLSALMLAGAAAVKFWPVLLFPALVRGQIGTPARALWMLGIFGSTTALLLLPQLHGLLQPGTGLEAYSTTWRTHALLFGLLEDGLGRFLEEPGTAARLIMAAFISGLALMAFWRAGPSVDAAPKAMLFAIAALIFLSPTGYPWYLVWLAPLLAFVPNIGISALVVTAPLYYFRFTLGAGDPIYDWVILPIAFGLPLLLFLFPLSPVRFANAHRHHHSRA